MHEVELPDGHVIEFPDDTPDQVITSVIAKNFPQFAPKNAQQGQAQNQQVSPEMYRRRQSEDTTGFKGIAQDALQSAKGLLSGLGNMALSLPGEAYGAGRQVITNPKRAASNAAAGVLGLPHTVLNAPANVADYLARKQLISPHDLHVNNTPDTQEVADILGASGNEKGDALIRALSQFNPALKAVAALGAPGRIGQAATFAVGAAGENQDPLLAAMMGPATEGIARVIGKAAKQPSKLAPTNLLRGKLTPEQLKANLENTAGTQTGLGDVIESPYLKRLYENKLTKSPYSGAYNKMQNTAQKVTEKGHALLQDMLGTNNPENIGKTLQDALKKAEKDAQTQKRQNFEAVNTAADAAGLKVGRENLREKAQDILSDISKSPELARELPGDVLHDLRQYASNKKGNSLKLSNIFKGKIGDKASEHYLNDRAYEHGIYRSLRDALNEDIDQSIENSGVPGLKEKHKNSKEFYQNNIAPFEDPDILKFIKRGGDSDTLLSHFLRISRGNDRQNLIAKLMRQLPQDQKQLVPFAYYSRALEDGQLNPLKLKTLHKNLGEGQKSALIENKQTKKALDQYTDLVSKNTEPLTVMFNPKTGQRAADLMPSIKTKAGGGALGYAAGGPVGAALGAMLAEIPSAIGSRLATHLLTSEKSRERFVNKIIKKEAKGEPLTKTEKAMAEFKKKLSSIPSALGKTAAPLELELNQYAGQEEQA